MMITFREFKKYLVNNLKQYVLFWFKMSSGIAK